MDTRNLIIAVLVSLLTGACMGSLDGPEEIKDLRVLGVATTPPELIYPATPPKNFETEVTFLAVNPALPDTPIAWRLTGCVVREEDGRCTPESEVPLAEGEDLPGEITAQVTLPEDLIMASFDADMFQGLFGAAVRVQGILVQEGEPEVRFIKSVLASPDYGLGRVANVNPWLDKILEGEEEDEIKFNLNGLWHVKTGTEYRLLPVAPEEAHETFITPAFEFEGDTADLAAGDRSQVTFTSEEVDEDLVYHFYTSIGGLSVEMKTEGINVLLESDEDREDRDLSVTFEAPAEPGTGTLWFVVDDERGGVGWTAIEVVVE